MTKVMRRLRLPQLRLPKSNLPKVQKCVVRLYGAIPRTVIAPLDELYAAFGTQGLYEQPHTRWRVFLVLGFVGIYGVLPFTYYALTGAPMVFAAQVAGVLGVMGGGAGFGLGWWLEAKSISRLPLYVLRYRLTENVRVLSPLPHSAIAAMSDKEIQDWWAAWDDDSDSGDDKSEDDDEDEDGGVATKTRRRTKPAIAGLPAPNVVMTDQTLYHKVMAMNYKEAITGGQNKWQKLAGLAFPVSGIAILLMILGVVWLISSGGQTP